MNYLAHLYFSTGSQNSLYGNLLGDFTSGNVHKYNNAEIIEGIALHREIDKFTDNHPVFIQSKNRVSEERRRFAGIMIDVFYDHFLALDWSRYSTIDFRTQTRDWYNRLNSKSDIQLPTRMKNVMHMMKEKDLFSLYKTQDGIAATIDGISRRIRFENNLTGGGDELIRHYTLLQNDFNNFFPELVTYVKKIKSDQ